MYLAFYDKSECESEITKPKHLVIALSSDRGLCGAIHSSICKAIRTSMVQRPQGGAETKIIAVGDKSRAFFVRYVSFHD